MQKRQKIRIAIILISFFLFPALYYYMSPYLIIDGTINRVIAGSFLLFTLQFLSALIAGRAFCGWICPAGGAQEAVMMVSRKRVTRGNWIKWAIWIPWVAAIASTAASRGGYDKVDPLYQTTLGLSINNVFALITYLAVLALIVIPAFLAGRRSFCHHICWMAPYMILGRWTSNLVRLPSLRLKSESSKCVHCHTCTDKCPMSLEVESMVQKEKMEKAECILCLTCVDGCNSGAIRERFGRL